MLTWEPGNEAKYSTVARVTQDSMQNRFKPLMANLNCNYCLVSFPDLPWFWFVLAILQSGEPGNKASRHSLISTGLYTLARSRCGVQL